MNLITKRLIFGLAWLWTGAALAQRPGELKDLAQLRYRFIGPDGNRAIAIAGEPGNPQVNYVGAASGGLWKTEDGGLNWRPVMDELDVSSVSALALAPSAPQQVWAGTGETFLIRPAHSVGNGIYFSPDAGKTWQARGLEKTGRIGRVAVHPRNPEVVWAAALGHTYAPQPDRGVYRTRDAGKTWERTLFVNENTGCADLAVNPQNPEVVYAAMWQVAINTWGLNSGGPGGGLYRSRDGGSTWEPLHPKGLPGGPKNPTGKVAVALCHSQPNVVYALFEHKTPELYRSTDGGDTWTLMSRDHSMGERAPYYIRLAVSPDNPDEVHYANVRYGISTDGGKTWERRTGGYRAGGDNHDIWWDPQNPNRFAVAHDGCASFTLNRGKTFQYIVLPIAQMYHVAVDNQVPYAVYGNRQDGWSYRGPSNSRSGGSIPLGLWHGVGGCESGFAKPDPNDPNIVWSGCYDGGLERYDLRTGHARDVRVWPEAAYGWKPADLRYRWHWNFPLSFSPHTKHRVYVGSQYVHKTDDGGQTWQVISPDLTTNDKTHQQSSGGIATDNLMTFDGCVLFAVEESPLQKDLIWVGTNDGQVQLTRNGGQSWTNLTPNLKMPPWGTIANIEPSPHDAATAYVSVDLHQMGDFAPYIFKTTDYGQTWNKISAVLPSSMLSFVHCVREDPRQRGLLYAGTDNALYVSPDDGQTWHRLQNNLPPAPVYWLTIQPHFDDLVVGTYGRGFYILDDLGALREYFQKVRPAPPAVHLFGLRPAYRFAEVEGIKTERGGGFNTGQNPPYGVPIQYFLKDSLSGEVKIEILQAGQVIRTLLGKNGAGLQRLWWDLRHQPVQVPKLRTTPPGKPWVEFNLEGYRSLVTWDLDLMAGQYGPKVAPGRYTVRLVAGGQTLEREVEVRKDPNTAGSDAEVAEQVAFSLELRDALNTSVGLINRVEWIRKELREVIKSLGDAKLLAAANRLDDRTTLLAAQLYDIHLTGAREDAFRNPVQLYERLLALASDIGASGIDFKPTGQQREVAAGLQAKLQTVQTSYRTLVEKDIPEFNQKLQKINKPLKINLERKEGEN
ncbi:MAG: glycosyl hydrolase [Bernardetiaceae bacterium]|jgi:photosystem II stability/assembly factor-like uncharacterized protein|nr:glycosyl hydrolase [Bernardetiaceae bacterium]